jgi:hypothetical protein
MISDIIEQILATESFRIIKNSYCRSNSANDPFLPVRNLWVSNKVRNAAIEVYKLSSNKNA